MPRRRVLLACIGAAAFTAAPARAAVSVSSGIRYGSAAPLVLDLYAPPKKARGGRPVVVLVHGGGFKGQSREDAGMVRIARGLARRGIAAASIDYRLMGEDPVPAPRYRPLLDALPDAPISRAAIAAVDDTITAVEYLRRHERELGLDVSRLGLAGASAGAITVDHVGYTLDDHGIRAPKIRFVASLWGGILVRPGASQLDRGEAAFFSVHGTADRLVPVKLDDVLAARARHQGVGREYHRIEGAGHGFRNSGFFTQLLDDGQTPFQHLMGFAAAKLG